MLNADPPARCDAAIVSTLAEACKECALPWMEMISRAYHDSLFMSRIAPVSMLFIPCRGGVSHRPDEYSSPEAVSNGARIEVMAGGRGGGRGREVRAASTSRWPAYRGEAITRGPRAPARHVAMTRDEPWASEEVE